MRPQLAEMWNKIQTAPYLANILALLGGAVYFFQAVANAHNRTSFLDEGLYLYKGLLFASGQYQPFQDFGPWTNHMPLSYLIPGFVQIWFGPGLRVGRYFAILLALLTLLGLWLITRRMAGSWWAVGVVWAMALNIGEIKLYTLAISQVVVAFLFVWTLVLTLGDDRPTWQIILGSALAGIMFFVRINMAPVLPLLVIYIFWQHGRRKGFWSLLVVVSALIIGHALFWPGILKIWAAWLPRDLTPWLNVYRLANPPEKWYTSADLPDTIERILYFFLTFRIHFLALIGALMTWLLWPGSADKWQTKNQYCTVVFLSAMLLVLLLVHMWAAFAIGFCISCILLYVAFFDFLGLLLLATAFSSLKRKMSLQREIIAIILVLGLALGIAYSAYGDIGRQWAAKAASIIGPGWKDLAIWKDIGNIFGVSRYNMLRVFVALGGGLVLGIGVFLITIFIYKLLNRKRTQPVGISFILLSSILIIGFLLTPTVLLSKGNDFFACEGDVIQTYETTGEYLSKTIPSRAKVFWVGRLPALFLYFPDVNVYLPQLNHYHSFRFGGDDQELPRFGLWNQSLGLQWITEADYVIVEDQFLEGWVKEAIDAEQLVELPSPPIPEPCRESSRMHIYVKR